MVGNVKYGLSDSKTIMSVAVSVPASFSFSTVMLGELSKVNPTGSCIINVFSVLDTANPVSSVGGMLPGSASTSTSMSASKSTVPVALTAATVMPASPTKINFRSGSPFFSVKYNNQSTLLLVLAS